MIDTNIEELFPELKLTEADVTFKIDVVKGPIDKDGSVEANENTWEDSVIIYGTLGNHSPQGDALLFKNVIIPNAYKQFTSFKYDPQFKVTAQYEDKENDTLYEAEQFVTLDVGGVDILVVEG